jgi:hypothetical protein
MSISLPYFEEDAAPRKPDVPPLIAALSAYVEQRITVRNEIERYKKLYAAYKAQLDALENQNGMVVQYSSMNAATEAGREVAQVQNMLYEQKQTRITLSNKLHKVLPLAVEDMLKRGSVVNIPQGAGLASYLIWYSDDGQYLVESLGFGQDSTKVFDDSERGKTLDELLTEAGILARYGH